MGPTGPAHGPGPLGPAHWDWPMGPSPGPNGPRPFNNLSSSLGPSQRARPIGSVPHRHDYIYIQLDTNYIYIYIYSKPRNPGPTDSLELQVAGCWLASQPTSQGASQPAKIRPLRKNVYTSRFSTPNPKSCNTHTYHFHISKSLNLVVFSSNFGAGGIRN